MNPTSLLVNVSLSIINWVKDSMKRCHVKQTLDYLIALLGLIVNLGGQPHLQKSSIIILISEISCDSCLDNIIHPNFQNFKLNAATKIMCFYKF